MRQLEFNLTPRAEHQPLVNPWKYRFTENALIEELDDRRFVYGLWESLFGCWIVAPVSGRSREIVPTWRPLNENGIWRDQWDVRFTVTPTPRIPSSPQWRYEANAAFAGYFAGIPQVWRSLVASFDHFQWLGLDLIWKEHGFAAFLDDALFDERQQFVFSCFALADATDQPRAWRHEFVTALMTEKRAGLLGRLSGLPCSKAAVRAIYKLGPTPCTKTVYRALINLVNEHPTSKAFCHAHQIQPEIIYLLELLPSAAVQTNIVSILLGDADATRDIYEKIIERYEPPERYIDRLFANAPEKVKAAMTDSFRQVRDIDQFYSCMDRWESRLIEAIEFPPSPVPTFEHLRPLTSAAAVREEGLYMKNCLADLIPDVLQGRAYFFHWDGPIPATVMLTNTPDEGWWFSQALGIGNEPIPEDTEHWIRVCFTVD